MRWFGSAAAQECATVPDKAPESLHQADAVASYFCGVQHYQRGQWEPAKQAFKQALELKHDLAEAHFYLGLIMRNQSQLEDASDCLLLATTFKPDFAEAWFYLGIVDHDRMRVATEAPLLFVEMHPVATAQQIRSREAGDARPDDCDVLHAASRNTSTVHSLSMFCP